MKEPIDLTQSSSANIGLPSAPEGGRHLYIENDRVEELPESGTITFRYVRGPITEVEALRGMPGRCSVDLTLTEICDFKGEKKEESEGPDLDKLYSETEEPEAE